MAYAPTLTTYEDAAPCPRVEVFFSSLDADTVTLTVTRTASGREHLVRGAVNAVTGGTFTRIDFEVPFGVATTYRAEMFDADGLSLGFTDTASVTVVSDVTWVHNPLDPQGAVAVSLTDSTGRALSRPVPVTKSTPLGRRDVVMLSERRSGLRGFQFNMRVSTLDDADRVQALIDVVPVVCIRLGGDETRLRIPKPLFLGTDDIVEVDLDTVWGGTDTLHLVQGDEATPPVPGLFIPLLTAADLNAYYETADDLNDAYATAGAANRDYSLAGYATA